MCIRDSPAAVLGLADHKGLLEPGYDADVVLVDIDHMYEVHADELHSKSKNCPYDGALLYLSLIHIYGKGGRVVTAATKFYCHLAQCAIMEYNITCIAMYILSYEI